MADSEKMTEEYMIKKIGSLYDSMTHSSTSTADGVGTTQAMMYCVIQLARIAESLAMLANNSEQLKEKPIVDKTEE